MDSLILRTGAAIRCWLDDLLPVDEVAAIDAELAEILNSEMSPSESERRVLDVLGRDARTKDWAAAYMKEQIPPASSSPVLRDARYQALPGDASPPGNEEPGLPPRYRCPQLDYQWFRRDVGQGIPRCPTHGVELFRVEEEQ